MAYYAHSREGTEKNEWHLLRDHLTAVASEAGEFGLAFGGREIASLAGLVHDLGKYSVEFQQRLEDDRLRVDHSTAGARVVAEKYGAVGRIVAYAVAGHHAGLPDGGDEAREGSLTWRLRTGRIPDFSAYEAEVDLPAQVAKPHIDPQPKRTGFSAAFFTRMLFSCLVDADFLDTERFLDAPKASARSTGVRACDALKELDERLAGHLASKAAKAPRTPVNEVRAQVLAECLAAGEREGPGLFTLTVPTGGGKTLSSLAFALKHALRHGMERVIYVIPFTSIIEQNARVFRRAVGAEAVLEHHSNAIRADVNGDEGRASTRQQEQRREDLRRRLELAEENWDMPLVVTTNVQFFESLFADRSSRCRKLHNIARSVVILDEAQMLPVELLEPCVAALVELVRNYGTSVVLCSATQPALEGLFPEGVTPREISRDPVALYNKLRRVAVTNRGRLANDEVVAEVMRRPQALCIVNTRAHARQLYELLGRDDGHFHLSAAMCPAHRTQRLDEIRARLEDGRPCRVVSTQLVEAGVDVDFPVVLRAAAGIDSIAQAAGRCNREGKHELGEVFVFWPAGDEGMGHVWFKRTASVAAPILEAGGDPLALDAVRRYFRDLYFYEGTRLDAHDIMPRFEADAKRLNFPFEEVGSLFRVIDEDTFGVVVPFDDDCRRLLDEARRVGISRRLARRLQRYTVSLRPWERKRLVEAGALADAGGLEVLADMGLYHPEYGLVLRQSEGRDDGYWIV